MGTVDSRKNLLPFHCYCACMHPCACVQHSHIIVVSMCDLGHNVEIIVYHPGLIFKIKDRRFSGAASNRKMSCTISILYIR